jgi:glycosyltransferase involved in cell wall biosynthesis
MKNVALFHWGPMSVHTYNLADVMLNAGINVHFYVYTPFEKNVDPFEKELITVMKRRTRVTEIKPTFMERLIRKGFVLLRIKGIQWAYVNLEPLLPLKTKMTFSAANYDWLIAVNQISLCWLHSVAGKYSHKIIYYSLEIFKKTDPGFDNNFITPFLKIEKRILSKIKALIIQDKDRAHSLLNGSLGKQSPELVYLPVSVKGEPIRNKTHFLHEKFELPFSKHIILYFGRFYQERKIEELIAAFQKLNRNHFGFVLHGDRRMARFSNPEEGVYFSSELISFDKVPLLIASATIGLAFYDNGWDNTKLTAFSSDKIARYMQTGVPFLAFNNESYRKLRSEFCCCELLDDFSQLQEKVNRIMSSYEEYREACFKAYEKYYNIDNTSKTFIRYITAV